MRYIGLTGSYAMGKSTVAGFFKELGVPVICADELVDGLYKTDQELFKFIQESYPDCISNNKIDRKKLSVEAFKNKSLLDALERLLHPKVEERRLEILEGLKRQETNCVLFDIPLLFEIEKQAEFDKIIVVYCRQETQLKRAIERGISKERLAKIQQSQMPVEEKCQRGDFLIDTDHSIDEVKQQVKKIYEELCARSF